MSTLAMPDVAAAIAAAFLLGEVIALTLVLILHHPARRPLVTFRNATDEEPKAAAGVSATTWLLLTLVAAALPALGDLARHIGALRFAYWLSPLTDPALLLVGPAVWCYARSISLLHPEPAPHWRNFAWHATPAAALCLLMASTVLAAPFDVPVPAERRAPAEWVTLLPIAAQMLAYQLAVVVRVRGLRVRLEARFANIEHRQLGWLVASASTFVALVLAWMATWSLPLAVSDLVTNLLLAIDIALLGVFGAQQLNVFARTPWVDTETQGGRDGTHSAAFTPPPVDAVAAPPAEDTPPVGLTPADAHEGTGKYAKSPLPATQAEAIVARLDAVMREDKAYLENDLTLPALAMRVGASSHQLSQVLSIHMRLSFFDYVNGLRVAAVQATLAQPRSSGRPLLEIALECGFGSKSAFNDAFKRVTGLTPGAYRKSLPGQS